MQIEKINLKIGDYQVIPVPTGEFGLDGGAMFGTVPKVLWQKTNPADDQNRIKMEARALLLKGPTQNILIDCGNGSDFIAKYGEKVGSKFSEIYKVEEGGNSLLGSLAKKGLKPQDIDIVILTHLHFDHCGGATCEKDGKIVPTFPKAKYFVQKKNFEIAMNPNIREKASYLAPNFLPLHESKVLNFLDGNTSSVMKGISVKVSHGHTDHHQMVILEDERCGLVYCGDVVPTSSHVRLAWVMGYDLDPLKLIEEKADILGQASDKNWYLFFEHDPYCDVALVTRNGADFQVAKRFSLV